MCFNDGGSDWLHAKQKFSAVPWQRESMAHKSEIRHFPQNWRNLV